MPVIVAALVIILDQIVKIVCASWLPTLNNSTFIVWNGVFHLQYAENTGVSLGMLSNFPIIPLIIIPLLITSLCYVIVRYYKPMPTLTRYALLLIVAGAVGNFIDRIALGYVRDMFYFGLFDFFIFNIADTAITVGTVMLCLDVLFFKGKAFAISLLQTPSADKEPKETNEDGE